MKKISVDYSKTTCPVITNAGRLILFIGIIGAFALGFTGFYDVVSLSKFGFLVVVVAVGLLFFAFLAFGICKALSELVKNSYLQRKVLEAKLLDEGYELEEIEEEN
jgi:Na+/H+-dicarboxylate symporter